MVQQCHLCRCSGAKLKPCSGCQKVYYCSTTCQKSDLVFHIFDCKTRHIDTAYYLAQAVYRDLLPEHPQTCEDYGFNRTVTPGEKSKLLGVYAGLIKCMNISPETIHDWRVRGVLVDEIKAAFYKLPEQSRGGYFPWFLQNEHVVALAGLPLPIETLHGHADAAVMRAWRFTGGSERYSVEEIRATMAAKPVKEQKCYTLYTLLLSDWYPSPAQDLWIDFGFASCRSQVEEMALCAQYRALITMCTFKAFYDAYRTHRLLDLFHSKGLQVYNSDHFRDLLHTDWKKSVWYLKMVVVEENYNVHPVVNYGFANCKNVKEKRRLMKVYKAFFESPNGDPLALHNAAIEGNMHDYLSKVIPDLKHQNLQRLMKNPCPLLVYHLIPSSPPSRFSSRKVLFALVVVLVFLLWFLL